MTQLERVESKQVELNKEDPDLSVFSLPRWIPAFVAGTAIILSGCGASNNPEPVQVFHEPYRRIGENVYLISPTQSYGADEIGDLTKFLEDNPHLKIDSIESISSLNGQTTGFVVTTSGGGDSR